MSAVMPMLISCTTKNASALAYRRSAAVARSSAPPMQPPWTATSTGTRAFSSAVAVHCSVFTVLRVRACRRPSSASPSSCPPANTDRSMPAQKCLPVLEITMARAEASRLMPVTISGSSLQNSGTMVLSSSGRESRTWATWSEISTSKQR